MASKTMTTIPTMTAVVIHEAGGPEVLKVQQWPRPRPIVGQVLIRVKAFGLNRSEMFTRHLVFRYKGIESLSRGIVSGSMSSYHSGGSGENHEESSNILERRGSLTGHSPSVKFPRVLGIEAVGLVEESPGNEFEKGEVVATAMGGMGRLFDGGYAEFTCVPAGQVQAVKTKIPWEQLGALPEMMKTAWGSLYLSLQLKPEDKLLIRGGTTSIGLAALALAKGNCASVSLTTRKPERVEMLKNSGADDVFIDNGSIAKEVRRRHPEGFSKILELVGVTVLADSLKCAKEQGIVCLTGIAGGKWMMDHINPMELIPSTVSLTIYASTSPNKFAALDDIAQKVVDGSIKIPIKTYRLDQIVEAHKAMEENTAGAKIVVLT
ncbi:GroES-like protein [Venustampulla echinocandica]|uniref:GroES-like protein n=1 Tax=Venustampulla echinocandica TaxID=2656787 RepID=A0A370TVY2_9HELO|nr:GroES-like protein [Venustampulla echinocandica]RDL39680.1 GroES-like protein [Venustampulla echinocandica]